MQSRLTLTLAIIDGFLDNVRASSFVVPLDMVVECMELPVEEDAPFGIISIFGAKCFPTSASSNASILRMQP